MSKEGKDQAGQDRWLKEEFLGADFGDERLGARFFRLAEELEHHPSLPINQATKDWAAAKAAYRFFENPKVSREKIMAPHFASTVERARAHGRVIVAQDTSMLDFTRHHRTSGLGPTGLLEDGFETRGLIFHTALAMTDAGLPLGLLSHEIWTRPEEEDARTGRKRIGSYAQSSLPIEQKESFKWIKALRATDVRASGLDIIMVADREADIFELFDEGLKSGIDLVVRLRQDRVIINEEEASYETISERLSEEKVRGRLLVKVPGTGKRRPRQAKLDVRYSEVTLSAQGRGISSKQNEKRTHDLSLSVVELTERDPPKGEARLHWALLTTLPANRIEEACQIVRLYRMRWNIELYFKTLKTGCNVEGCRLETAEKLIKYVSLLSVVAWRILWMTKLNRLHGEESCEVALTRHEWQTLWLRINKQKIRAGELDPTPPNSPPTVREALRWLAQTGGFLARKGDGEPGLITIWRGWLELMPAVEMYETLLPKLQKNTHIQKCG